MQNHESVDQKMVVVGKVGGKVYGIILSKVVSVQVPNLDNMIILIIQSNSSWFSWRW